MFFNIRVIRAALWRNPRAFLVSVFGFRQKVLLISASLKREILVPIICENLRNLWTFFVPIFLTGSEPQPPEWGKRIRMKRAALR
jgi:hypothetical protein